MGQMLGICHSESSFPYLHGAARSWAKPQEGVPGSIQLKALQSLWPAAMVDRGKSCWETDPARQPRHLAEATFHLFSANQEVGAQVPGPLSPGMVVPVEKRARSGVQGSIGPPDANRWGRLEMPGSSGTLPILRGFPIPDPRAYFIPGLQMGSPLPLAHGAGTQFPIFPWDPQRTSSSLVAKR